jgi:integrase
MEKLTKRRVDAANAPVTGESVIWDGTLAGFGLRVRPSGSKVYFVQYRAGRGRSAPVRKVTIGRHGSPWTPDSARLEAKRLLGMVAGGADPAAAQAERRQADTLKDLANRFLEEHVAAKRKQRTGEEYQRLLEKFVLPKLGKKKLEEVTRGDIAKLHHSLAQTPYQANRVLAVCSALFTKAEAWGLRADGSNPCRHVERFPEKGRERMLSGDEFARLHVALERYQGRPYVTGAIRLLLFTGCRLEEVLTLRWDDIDFDRSEIRLRDSKTGARIVQLSPPAIEVLADLPREAGNPHVIPGLKEGRNLVNLQKPWRAIRTAAGLDDVRIHDLRHSFASVAASNGQSLPMIGKMLGHKQPQTTARYAHLQSDPLKQATTEVGIRIANAMHKNKNSS